MANEITVAKQPKFSEALQSVTYQNLIKQTLGEPERASRFVASISSAVAVNPSLQECTPGSILSGALLGESLQLSPSPQLGQMYLVPFKRKIKTQDGKTHEIKEAQFILGAKGYKQLAIRSGQYKDLDFIEIREGEYLGRDEETGKQKFKFIQDDEVREALPIIGYLAYFELLNGYRKQIYWSHTKMLNHADHYSKAFNKADYERLKAGKIPEKDMWQYSSYWYSDFTGMAEKTLYRQLISKYGVMSIDMQNAYVKDMAVLKQDGTYEYVDNPQNNIVEEKIEESKKVNLDEI